MQEHKVVVDPVAPNGRTAPAKRARDRRSPVNQPAPVVLQFQAVPSTDGVPKTSKRLHWVRLAADGDYADWQMRVRIRYPDWINEEFGSGEYARYKKALRLVVEEHNGWIDPETDKPFPPVSDDAFWAALDQAEVYLMLRAMHAARKKVFDGLMEMSGN